MKTLKIGYARVSTTGQSLDIQIEKLKAVGCEKIFTEKQSGGSKTKREALSQALDYVREGDIFIITKLDRLARSVSDLSTIAKTLEKKNVNFEVLDQSINTATPTGRLLYNVLGAIGEFEKDLINERVSEGLEKAKKRGVKLGRKSSLTEKQKEELQEEFKQTNSEERAKLAEKYRISVPTMYRYCEGLSNVDEED